jgi:hypothetical protein
MDFGYLRPEVTALNQSERFSFMRCHPERSEGSLTPSASECAEIIRDPSPSCGGSG